MRISDWSSDVCSSDLEAQDRVRLGQHATVVELDRRHRAGRADAQERLAPALALEDAHVLGAMRQPEVVQQLAHLPGVLRGQVVVQGQHGRHSAWKAAGSTATAACELRFLRWNVPAAECPCGGIRAGRPAAIGPEIGRASWRGSVGRYGYI